MLAFTPNTWERSRADSEKGGWVPQGLTASHGASPEGTVNGNHLYLAGWYHGTGGSQNEYARVSLVKNDNTAVTYGHVLLVTPTAGGSFEPTRDIHVDGMVWYGNRLFVANGSELQVYDMRALVEGGKDLRKRGRGQRKLLRALAPVAPCP
ncbi:hypothetical protein ACLGIH_33085 [Streptomyces sp. HMX87]|uniref:hypothetical protein n=1 Tax=Streptomyces sp. HMX87 TaxID=3390849 RepID=UPI003A8377AB